MNTKTNAINSIIQTSLAQLKTVQTNIAKDKWREAEILSNLKSLPWQHSPYGSFADFIDKEMKVHAVTVYTKAQAWETAQSLGYSMKELASLSDQFAFTNLRRYFAVIDKKVSVRTLKRKFDNKSIAEEFLKSGIWQVHSEDSFIFHLDTHNANKLKGILSQYGMYITDKNRKMYASDAMNAWLETL